MGAKVTDPGRISITVCYLRGAADHNCNIRERATALGLDYVELVERTAFDYGMWVSLRELVRARGIDIVHAHDYKTNLLALMLARTDGRGPDDDRPRLDGAQLARAAPLLPDGQADAPPFSIRR